MAGRVGEREVWKRELQAVLARRRTVLRGDARWHDTCGVDVDGSGSVEARDVRDLRDTVGVALSGGGIRSAAVTCGALTAFAEAGLLHRVDYVSCVSGGGYTTTALLTHMQTWQKRHSAAATEGGSADVEHQGTCAEAEGAAHSIARARMMAATHDLAAQMSASASYLVHAGADRKQQGKDVAVLVACLVRMLLGMPLFVVSACVLAAQCAYQMFGDRLEQLLHTPLRAWHIFPAPIVCSAVIVVAAAVTLVSSRKSIRRGAVSSQVFTHVAVLALGGGLSCWLVLLMMVIDERLSSTADDEIVEAAAFLVVAVTGVGAAVGVVSMTSTIVTVACIAAPISVLWLLARITTTAVHDHGLPTWWVIGATAVVALFITHYERLAPFLHHYYRRRLLAAFYKGHTDVYLRDLDTRTQPYLLCNTVVNDYVSHSATTSVASFTLTPHYVGARRLGFSPTPARLTLSRVMAISGGAVALAMGNTDPDGKLRLLLSLLGISLGDWFAVKGDGAGTSANTKGDVSSMPRRGVQATTLAAAVVVVGSFGAWWHASGAMAFVASACTLVTLSLFPPFRWLLRLGIMRHIHQALGVVHVGKVPPYVYLSDGGHLDNLGLLPLLKRRCSYMVAFDNGYDPQQSCEDLRRVMTFARTHLGCSFVTPPGCTGDAENAIQDFVNSGERRVLHLTVQYSSPHRRDIRLSTPASTAAATAASAVGATAAASPALEPSASDDVTEATLLFAKSRVIAGDGDLKAASASSRFPNHPTSFQFFSPDLFRRYQELGTRIGLQAAQCLTHALHCATP